MSAELATLTAYGAELVAGLQERVKSYPATRFGPVNASGNLAKSLRCEVLETATGYRLTLYAASYALTLEYGRKPGKFPNLLAIQEWLEAKGIVPRPDAKGRPVSTKSLAFMVARKIAEKGTTIYQSGSPSMLFGAVLGPEQVRAAVISRITPVLLGDVRSAIHSILVVPLPA